MFNNIILLTCVAGVFGCTPNPVVHIQEGKVRGKCVQDDHLYSFTSIPFAKPPVGSLRFEPPQPIQNWNGVLNATNAPGLCTQIEMLQVVGNEDCLYLNVYTPKLHLKRKLPVMVYMHGGGYTNGGANLYYPNKLVKNDVVVVIPNYRLGVLGFLSTENEVVPGNMGLKDQNLALKWVKRNIKKFGGDCNKITVFGESAGASSAHLHMLSPLSKDLISGVICQSGVANAPWGLDYYNQVPNNTKNLAQLLNCSAVSNHLLVKCLKKVSIVELIEKSTFLPSESLVTFPPVIEPDSPLAFISKHPFDILKSNQAAQVPFMTGMTTEEATYVYPDIFRTTDTINEFNTNFSQVMERDLGYPNNPYKNCITNRVKQFYYNNEPITNSTRSRRNVEQMFTDRLFLYPLSKAIEIHLNYTNNPVYSYAFGFRGSRSLADQFGDWYKYGVSHTDDLFYLFPDNLLNEVETRVSKLLIRLWTNFATYRTPTPGCTCNTNCWTPVETNNVEYFLIRNYSDTRMLNGLYKNRKEFWNSFNLEDNDSNNINCV